MNARVDLGNIYIGEFWEGVMHLVCTLLWRNLEEAGTEFCRLWQGDDGFRLDGSVTMALNYQPLCVQYQVDCNIKWQTTAVAVELLLGAEQKSLNVTVDSFHRWWMGEREVAALRGCIDVDLGISPATNTLPLRRLALAAGSRQEMTAAWVRFPELTLEPLPQRYTRLTENRYRYESVDSGYSADLTINELGLVVAYAGGWRCETLIKAV